MTKEKIASLEKEIAMTKEFILPLEDIGIKGSVVANSFLNLKMDTLDDIKKVTKLFPPSGKLFELRFAGRDNEPTLSPFSVHVNNYQHSEATHATVKYQSEKIEIWMELPLENFDIGRTAVDKQHIVRGKTQWYTEGYNTSVKMGSLQVYAGGSDNYGSRVSYAENDIDAEDFMDKFYDN